MQPASDALEDRIRHVVREALGVDVQALEGLPRGLGTRAFYRVRMMSGKPERLVARVEAVEDPAKRPSGVAPEPALEPTRTFLAEHAIPVPKRFGGDEHLGIDLLEDLGSQSLKDALQGASEDERRSLYEEACDLVVLFQRAGLKGGPVPAFGRFLDRTLIHFKADLFAEWSLPTALGRAPRASEREAVHEAFGRIADEVEAAPSRLAHRDFQSSNLHVRKDRAPGKRLGVIDFQGAFLAPPEYDLVCLLHDSYVELPSPLITELCERIRPELPDAPEPEDFARRFDLLTLSRKGKDHARFLSAAALRGEQSYLQYVGSTVRALRGAAARCAGLDPALASFAELIDALPETPPCAP